MAAHGVGALHLGWHPHCTSRRISHHAPEGGRRHRHGSPALGLSRGGGVVSRARGGSDGGAAGSQTQGEARVDDDCLRRRLVGTGAALVLALGPAPTRAHAFVPIRGCGDPGSPYDTGIVTEEARRVGGNVGCTKLYQPARAAEVRAAAAAREAAQAPVTDGKGRK